MNSQWKTQASRRRPAANESPGSTRSEAVVEALAHFSIGARANVAAADGGSRLQQAAWQAARQMMSSASWPRESPRTPHGPHLHDVPGDEHQPGQRQGPLAPTGVRKPKSGDGERQQRQALERWETEGGAPAPGIML